MDSNIIANQYPYYFILCDKIYVEHFLMNI